MSSINVTTQVYREIDASNDGVLAWLDQRDQLFSVTDPDGAEHLFVDNETPRDADITPSVMDATVGFALFTDDGDYIGSYKTLARAVEAQEKAQIVVSADVQDAEPDEVLTSDEA